MKIVPPDDTTQYPKLNRIELIDLVQKIMNGDYASDEEVGELVSTFEVNTPHPAGSDLIFYPEVELESAEEIVDLALSYKPIQL